MANYNVFEGPRHVIKAWTQGVFLDDNALAQVKNIASLPFIYKWVSVMPDGHKGIGAVVGSVIATKGAISPAAVGVDLGCGVAASRTDLTASDLPDNLREIRNEIEARIPHGRSDDGGRNDRGAWGVVPSMIGDVWDQDLNLGYLKIIGKYPKLDRGNHCNHLGTLGTGNHFIEICLDTDQNVWVMLHSGSRGVGNRIGSFFIKKAQEEMKKYFIELPDPDLAYLPEGTQFFDDYCQAVSWAQGFAAANRQIMMEAVYGALSRTLKRIVQPTNDVVNCHHNYISRESHYGQNVWVTRKGALRAREGDMGIIPGSMGAKSYIVRGKGNPESFHSCSHGAGRVMSRTEAKKRISMDRHIEAVKGVECRLDADVIDESPDAYKDIDAVMEAQKDLVEIVHTLKQVVCVKG